MKNKKYYIVVSVPKPNRQIGETEVILIPKEEGRSKHMYKCSLSWHCTGPSIKSGGVELVLYA